MSKTVRAFQTPNEFEKPRDSWQVMRGERYGNQRKAVAKTKKEQSQLDRTRRNREIEFN